MWEKIVLNLLSNALKFTFHGSIVVALDADGPDVELRVQDTGVGIAPRTSCPRLRPLPPYRACRGAHPRRIGHRPRARPRARGDSRRHHPCVTACRDRARVFRPRAIRRRAPAAGPRRRGGPRPRRRPAQCGAVRGGGTSLACLTSRSPPSRCPASRRRPAARVLIADDNADMRDYLRGCSQPRYQSNPSATETRRWRRRGGSAPM